MQYIPTLQNEKIPLKHFAVILFLTYLFSLLIRFIWIYQFNDVPNFYWNNQLMINTNDGYYFAEGARDILAGFHQPNDLSPVSFPISRFTAFIAQLLPITFESLILYMPAFLGSLIVLPILLISYSIKQTTLGVIAALLGSITWSYYNRTMVGYYDTDMLNVVLPILILSTMIFAATHQRNRYLILIPFSIIAFQVWYHGSYSINVALVGMFILYTLLFERHNTYFYKIILFSLIALISISIYLKIILTLILAAGFHYYNIKNLKLIFVLILGTITAILLTGGVDPVIYQLNSYVTRETTMSHDSLNLRFFNVAQTVREAGQIPFETFANRISGHTITFIFSLFGYLWLVYKHKVLLLSLPLLGLGFLAYGFSNLLLVSTTLWFAIGVLAYPHIKPNIAHQRILFYAIASLLFLIAFFIYYKDVSINGAGLRFTVYAVPIMALGFGYLIIQMATYITQTRPRYLFITLATTLALLPNIIHIIDYKVPTVFSQQEVAQLDQLKDIATREDYVVTWWDYGYPIRYYADVKTLVDGGKHTGDVNFPASYAMTRPQQESAYLSRLAVEYTELAFEHNRSGTYIQMMMQDNDYTNPNDFLESMKLGLITPPKKSRDIYYYLPLRMLDIYPTMALFSDIDLSTGKAKPAHFLYQSHQFQEDATNLLLGPNINFNKQSGIVTIQNQKNPVALFTIASYTAQGKLRVTENPIHFDGKLYVIYMPSYHRVLLMDKATYYSTYIQLFILEHYDTSLYEQISISPFAKIYRLKN